ncbi:HDIG domain-containing protein [Paenibacillus sp. 1_12]|uniref:HD-GYP domain-containing protein n=1 Tax=Paenibacillus sp. 1_12 TaxID=1566278 RepID=UPI0008E9D084|nr:HD-GYP domain-containing protein [Paenibacillus sp. 1_12]SFM19810.1 HDIG domain-containing protein [Paenibacillus sp. 1_12]
MRVSVMDLQVGDRTGSDIFNKNGLLVVSAHTVLNSSDISKLNLHHIDYVDLMIRFDNSSNHPESAPLLEEDLSKHAKAYEEAVDGIKDLFEQVERSGKLDESQVNESFAPLSNEFAHERDVVSLLLTLNNQDDYTYQHSVQVGMISYYIAKWLGQTNERALIAGKAGYLHDIGKCRIDKSILTKPGRLTDEEFEEIKQHPVIGYQLIKDSNMSEALAQAALQHHERFDGSGYPHGIKGSAILPLSKIVAVADIYSAMISSRVYQKKRDLLFVLRELHRLSFGKLDPKITQVFIRNMIPNFIGKRVLLSSGETGFIVLTHPSDMFKPLVQVDDHFVNLTDHPELVIEEVYV